MFPVLLCLRHLPLSVLAHLCVYICVKCVREPRKSGVANSFSSGTVANLCVGFPNHKPQEKC